MKRIYFSIPGKPKAQKRHRDAKHGGKYDPSAADKQEFNLQSRRYAPKSPISGPVLLYLVFYMPVPKGALKALKETARHLGGFKQHSPAIISEIISRSLPSVRAMTYYYDVFHTKKPDAGNLQKLVEDALNGLMWVDDSQVQIGGCYKIYSHNPRTEVELFFEEGPK